MKASTPAAHRPNIHPIQSPQWHVIYLLGGITFTHILDFMILMPLGPMLRRHLQIGPDAFGLLVSSYSFAAAIAGLLGAFLLDQFERKKILILFTGLFSLSTLACALAPDYHTLLMARVLTGAFGGLLNALTGTLVGDYVAPEHRGRAGGIFSSAFALATVAGIPISLFLANHVDLLGSNFLLAEQGWRVPFALVALLGTSFCWLAQRNLPKRAKPQAQQIFSRLRQTISDKNHLWAMAFGCTALYASFSVIPYLTLYATGTLHFPEKLLSVMYLVGGATTLITARLIGRRTDRIGKHRSYYQLGGVALIPVLLATHAHFFFDVIPPWLYIVVSTLFFVFVSGRWIPAMALMTSAAKPELRGTFMSLNTSLQQAAMGLATLLSGHIVSIDAQGHLEGFHYVAYVSMAATLLTFWLASHVKQRS